MSLSDVGSMGMGLVLRVDSLVAGRRRRPARGAEIVVVALLAAAMMVLGHSGVAQAQCASTIVVFDRNTLNDAIGAVNNQLDPCEYRIQFANSIFVDQELDWIDNTTLGVIISINGDGYTLDAGEGPPHQVLHIGPSTTVTIHDLVITGSTMEGGIYNRGTLTAYNVSVLNTAGADGLGIENSGGSAVIQGGQISGHWDGIESTNGATTVVSGTVVSDNWLAGIVNDASSVVTVTGSLISGNYSYGVHNSNIASIADSTISGTPDTEGAAIYSNKTLTVTRSTIMGNDSTGIWKSNGVAAVLNSTVSGNSGAGFLTEGSTALLMNDTFSDNGTALVANNSSWTWVQNSILANSNGSSGDCEKTGTMYATFKIDHSLIEEGYSNCLQSGGAGSLTGIDPRLGPLQPNGGPTWTRELLAGSPALDAGDATNIGIYGLTTDQRGAGFPRVVGGYVDMGALEMQIFTLNVSTAGGGTGSVTSNPAGIHCGATCSAVVREGTVFTLTASADAGSLFTGWSGVCSGMGTCTLTVSRTESATATFAKSVQLEVMKAGGGTGTVTSNPAGIDCGATCSAVFAEDTVVTLTASADVGAVFTGWSGACSGMGICTLTVSSTAGATATFAKSVQLTVMKAGSGTGTVTSNSAGIDCGATCSGVFAEDSAVMLTASADVGSVFTGWSGGCSGRANCDVIMSSPQTVTASFEPSHPLTVTKAGSGTGTVTSVPAGIDCGTTCNAQFLAGTVVTLTASADSGSTFAGWSGACSGKGTCVVTMTAAKTVTATFALQPPAQYTLSVTRAGNGTGKVTSSPAGIDCGADCEMTAAPGTVITLTAQAADTVSTFAGWSGDGCTGMGACVLSLDANKSVVAAFVSHNIYLPVTQRAK